MNATKPEKLCKNCAKPIPAGEEIKIESVLWDYEYSINHGKYSGGWRTYRQPIEKAFYWFCQSCFREYEKLIAKERTKTRKRDIFWTWMIIFLVVVGVVALWILAYWFENKKK